MTTYEILALGVLAGVVLAALRHLQGGEDAALGLHRWEVVLAYTASVAPAAWAYWGSSWFGVSWLGMLKPAIMLILFDADMTLKQDYSSPWGCTWRFGLIPLLLIPLTGWWPAVFVGPIVGGGTWLLKKLNPTIKSDWFGMAGWEPFWELMIGGVPGFVWAVAPFFGGPCAISLG